MLIGRLYIYFGEMSVHILCPFLKLSCFLLLVVEFIFIFQITSYQIYDLQIFSSIPWFDFFCVDYVFCTDIIMFELLMQPSLFFLSSSVLLVSQGPFSFS